MAEVKTVAEGALPREVQEELLRSLPKDPMDFLTDDDKRRLQADLTHMSRVRRQAEADSAFIVMY